MLSSNTQFVQSAIYNWNIYKKKTLKQVWKLLQEINIAQHIKKVKHVEVVVLC